MDGCFHAQGVPSTSSASFRDVVTCANKQHILQQEGGSSYSLRKRFQAAKNEQLKIKVPLAPEKEWEGGGFKGNHLGNNGAFSASTWTISNEQKGNSC
ncbi:hypothetical protein Nepgr_002766 [Nepenthes gracilis]|uniref:Uncharacterized protein n=1 Tax=Nepenthes gracilis TaxID=150966 RepID=A0AAD3P7P1_NEPGR|nr:hypothetical protein Nepgr_002766 [Nepenthes gracilis]